MYTNERIIEVSQTDASIGVVVLSASKLLWMGSMFSIAFVGGYLTFSLNAVLVFVLTTGITICLGHSLGMHRRLIHKSYQCPKWMEYLFVHLGTIVGLAGPFGMISTHDMRDWAQRQKNCHDYFGHKQPMWRDFFWQVFCDIKLAKPPQLNIESEVFEDPVYRWMEKTWMLQQLPLALILFVAGGIPYVVWGIAARVSISVFGHWFIGYFAHNEGHRDWHVQNACVQGHNVRFAAILTMGESYHNNHHAFPGSANLGLEQGQIDPGWWVLKGLEKLGLVWGLVEPSALPEREELTRLA